MCSHELLCFLSQNCFTPNALPDAVIASYPGLSSLKRFACAPQCLVVELYPMQKKKKKLGLHSAE